jgi:hypothetical protein
MAVTNQQIFDYLLANPGLSDAQLAADMATYGVSPAQMAAATGTKESEIIARAAATVPEGSSITLGDTRIAPQYEVRGSGEDRQVVGIENIYVEKTTGDVNYKAPVGSSVQVLSPTGDLVNTIKTKEDLSFFGGLADAFNDPIVQAAFLGLGGGGALGSALGLTGSTAQAVGTGLFKGGTALAGGAEFEDALKTGLLSGSLVYGGNALNNYLTTGTTADPGITERQFAAADAKQLADQGLSPAQIKDTLTAGGYNDITVERAVASVTTPPVTTATTTPPTGAVSTPVIDNAAVNITGTAAPSINTSGLLGSLVTAPPVAVSTPVTDGGTVKVTGTSTPQQVNQAVVDLINSQLGTNVGTPANLANVQITDKAPVVTPPAINTIAATIPAVVAPPPTVTPPPVTTPPAVSDPTVTITDKAPVVTPPAINTIAATIPTVIAPPTTTPTTTPETTKKNDLNVTDDQIINILKALGLFGTLGVTTNLGSTNTPVPVTGIPTQTPPMYTDDYFTKVQQNYNNLLPAVPRDVASPLRDWYTSQYGA